jgi:hypothetical protein
MAFRRRTENRAQPPGHRRRGFGEDQHRGSPGRPSDRQQCRSPPDPADDLSRRAAAEMIRRVEHIARQVMGGSAGVIVDALTWAGTFHGIGARLLREYADQIEIDPVFTVHDRSLCRKAGFGPRKSELMPDQVDQVGRILTLDPIGIGLNFVACADNARLLLADVLSAAPLHKYQERSREASAWMPRPRAATISSPAFY